MATGDLSEEIRKLVKDLGKIPPELRKQLRPALKAAAEPIVTDARGRASWSMRIPGAITLSVRMGARNPGVSLRVRRAKAPHGRPYEGITGRTSLRHPVFGHRDRWVTQPTKSFLAPAAEAGMDGVLGATAAVVDQVAREQGFR
ncbi:HK97 gp10 family phage protein [Streptosporangium saharense]|uniref:HK97 gp10 family phage protein n=1 Tax=Streptosporangium saharense TaxID=1706840 RepID=UPI00341F0B55